jgi:tRNA pseudouridine38-40 synthase
MWIEDVRQARSDFHPRYDAIARTYTYRVGTVEQACSPFHRRWCWALDAPLDASLLSAAAEPIVGERSFEAFAKSGQPERGTRCRVVSAVWTGWELGSLFRITADRYLHHMVRYLVGTMVDVARGRRGLDDMNHLLRGRPAMTTSPPAPPEGLFLTHVEYPDTALVSVPSSPRRDTTAGRK